MVIGHPAGQSQRESGGDCGEENTALLRRQRPKTAQRRALREHKDSDAEIFPARLVALLPNAGYRPVFDISGDSRELRTADRKMRDALRHGYTGTRVESTISPRIASACSDFFCVET